MNKTPRYIEKIWNLNNDQNNQSNLEIHDINNNLKIKSIPLINIKHLLLNTSN